MVSTAATMDLSQACTLLKSTSTTDNARWFSETYKNAGFGDGDELNDYIQHILHDARAWVDTFPDTIVALSTFKKPKTALIALLSAVDVIELLGAEKATLVKSAVEAVFNDKKFMKNVVKERKSTVTVEKTDIPETVDPQHDMCLRLRHENEALRKALMSLAKDLPGGEAITILALSIATL